MSVKMTARLVTVNRTIQLASELLSLKPLRFQNTMLQILYIFKCKSFLLFNITKAFFARVPCKLAVAIMLEYKML